MSSIRGVNFTKKKKKGEYRQIQMKPQHQMSAIVKQVVQASYLTEKEKYYIEEKKSLYTVKASTLNKKLKAGPKPLL